MVELEIDFRGLEKLENDELVVFGSEFAKKFPDKAENLFDGLAEELGEDALTEAVSNHADPSQLAEALVHIDRDTAKELAEYILGELPQSDFTKVLESVGALTEEECNDRVEEAKDECENRIEEVRAECEEQWS